MTKKVRMLDIARELGVTTVTVSNALNDRPGVSDAMRRRIAAKAKEMGYVRLRNTDRNIRTQKLRLGVIVPAYFLSESNAFYWAFFQSLAREADLRGMTVAMEQLESYTIRHMILPDLVTDGNCDLLVFLGPSGKEYLEMVLDSVKQPCVCLDCSSPTATVPSVVSSNYYGMAEMTEYLIRAGHSEIGFLGNVGATESITDRYLGYRRALATNNIPYNKRWQIDDRKIQNGKVIIELPDRLPEAFVCNSDRSAAALIELLESKGLKVPEDVSLVSYDGHLPASETLELTTMAVDFDEMARAALTALTRLYEKREPEQWRYVIPGNVIEGRSVQKIKRPAEKNIPARVVSGRETDAAAMN